MHCESACGHWLLTPVGTCGADVHGIRHADASEAPGGGPTVDRHAFTSRERARQTLHVMTQARKVNSRHEVPARQAHLDRRHYDAIRAALTTGMSNRLIESTNTKTRLIIRRGFGLHSPTPSSPSSISPSPATSPPSPTADSPQSDPHIRQESRKGLR
ncbi:transposase [Streptomyces sp. A5-4]|uniref:transposase n=1 Tax=Streptomyces sp. A5-4 TaxID=3384771 RepID=UPI003DA9F9E8